MTDTPASNHFKNAAPTWDTPERVALARLYADKIKNHLEGTRPRKILEIGCGTGLLGANFIDGKSEFLGVDTSQGMLAVFQQKHRNQPSIRAKLLDLETQELEETGFDLVISSMAFHHLTNPTAVLVKVHTLLSPGGQVAVIDLDKEDGSFHADPENMGVKHFGFSRETLYNWSLAAGFKSFSYEIVNTIIKDSGRYPIFLAMYS